ncbi:phage GP46 family protein [Nitrosovibrio sp. Nv4]|uniref:phage GP46 family protein n=1 Tax=Nitrosovibrio sp. Nv4 TaxID=1945880 RepID=UPI000BD51E49|nr:phage GP46 family protein [Nitrosovibrio sp. Nv4]SOD42338.1 Mu-like prophage protein gp46 [Nitrosovibrio sp. Nv4]
MSDIRTLFFGFERGADYALDALGLTSDDGLETAVILSLFTDRQAEPADIIPDGTTDQRGWWADAFADVPADKIGSRLWLLHREKQLQSVVNRAREYAQESLDWLVDDGVAKAVTVTAEVVRTGVLGLSIEIVRPDSTVAKFRFDNFWKAA